MTLWKITENHVVVISHQRSMGDRWTVGTDEDAKSIIKSGLLISSIKLTVPRVILHWCPLPFPRKIKYVRFALTPICFVDGHVLFMLFVSMFIYWCKTCIYLQTLITPLVSSNFSHSGNIHHGLIDFLVLDLFPSVYLGIENLFDDLIYCV